MSKEVSMTFRVEPELRYRFTKIAEDMHRPAAQLLRELMRNYVGEIQAKEREAIKISESERKRREEAFQFAKASVGLEGLELDMDEQERARKFINGEIELNEFTKIRHK